MELKQTSEILESFSLEDSLQFLLFDPKNPNKQTNLSSDISTVVIKAGFGTISFEDTLKIKNLVSERIMKLHNEEKK